MSSIKSEKKLSVGTRRRGAGRINSCHEISVIFSRGQTGKFPLVASEVVIVSSDTDGLINLCKAGTARQVNLILHVAEKVLLRGVALAVGLAGHGLAKLAILHHLDKLHTGMMDTLVAVDQGLGLQR